MTTNAAATTAPPPWQPVLDFWFGTENPARPYREAWFKRDDAFDAEIRRLFLPALEAAAAGQLDAWAEMPQGALALLILLDQFPRNLFRNDGRAYATDAKALGIARMAVIERGWDRAMLLTERMFLYLPFEHSEALADQHLCCALFEGLRDEPGAALAIDYAWKHLFVIQRFGRFPHRNAELGRDSSPAERDFLKSGRGY